MTATAINDFKNKLAADNTLTLHYLAAKIGFDPADPTEFEKALGLYEAMNIVSTA